MRRQKQTGWNLLVIGLLLVFAASLVTTGLATIFPRAAAAVTIQPGYYKVEVDATFSSGISVAQGDTITVKNGNSVVTTQIVSATNVKSNSASYITGWQKFIPTLTLQACSRLIGKCKTFSSPGTVTMSGVVTSSSTGTIPSAPINGPPHPTCEASGLSLSWIICPVYNGLAGAADWLFAKLVEPMLTTQPIDTTPAAPGAPNPTYAVWSSFRTYGNIFLVLALLVIVFGQSIGGGLIDAYTAKKTLPRILIAAILLNLSIYIVAFLVDVTNIVGGGLGQLMTHPLAQSGAFKITPSGLQSGEIIGLSGIGVIAAAVKGFVAIFSGDGLLAMLLFVIMPVLFGLLAAFVTMVIRQAIILALVLVSPVAFALYCLPNTEKYFKKWWGFLLQTLMVYPIVVMIFAVSDILAVTVMGQGQGQGGVSPLAPFISFLLQFLPLLGIPYAFRLAGGAIGKAHEALTQFHKRGQEAIKGNVNDPNSLRNRARRNLRNNILTSQSNSGGRLQKNTLLSRLPGAQRLGRSLQARATADQAILAAQMGEAAFFKGNQNNDEVLGLVAHYGSAREAYNGEMAKISQMPESTEEERQAKARAVQSLQTNLANARLIGWNQTTRRLAYEKLGQVGYQFDSNVGTAGHALAAQGEIDSFDPTKDARYVAASIAGGSLNDNNDFVGGNQAMFDRLIEDFQYNSKQAGQWHLSRAGVHIRSDGSNYSEVMRNRWNNANLYQIANSKAADMKAVAKYWVKEYTASRQAMALNPGDAAAQERFVNARKAYHELDEMKKQGHGTNSDTINKAVNEMDNIEAQFRGTPQADTIDSRLMNSLEARAKKEARTYDSPRELSRFPDQPGGPAFRPPGQ